MIEALSPSVTTAPPPAAPSVALPDAHQSESHARERPFALWASRPGALIALTAIVTLARLVYLAFFSRIPLVEDEAHYWEWSRRLEWAYYSKGPGTAWLIRASTSLLGDTEFAVRLPSVLCAAVTLIAIGGLAGELARDRRVGFFTAACLLCTPLFQGVGLMMTIDGPFSACWAVAAWAGWRAFTRPDHAAARWMLVGLLVGVGVLFKYTILLLIPGLALVALAWHRSLGPRSGSARIGILVGFMFLAACLSPMLIWNATHGLPTLRHLLGNMELPGGDRPVHQLLWSWRHDPRWILELLGSQAALIGVVLALIIIQAVRAWRARRADPRRWAAESYVLLTAAPVLLFYLTLSLIGSVKGNWPLAGWLTLMPLAGWRVVEGIPDWQRRVAAWRALPRPRPRAGFFVRQPETPTQVLCIAAFVTGVVVAVGGPLLPVAGHWPVIGPLIPLSRFTGAPLLAADAGRLAAELERQTGKPPFIIATHWGVAGQIAFYLPGHPTVYCSSGHMAQGRRTQYDYWARTDLVRVHEELQGRPAVLIGERAALWAPAFAGVHPVGRLDGDTRRGRLVSLGYGYRGFDTKREERGE